MILKLATGITKVFITSMRFAELSSVFRIALVCLHCRFFIHSTFSLKSFYSLDIVSQNLSMSFIAGVSFTVTFSYPISLWNFFA